MNKLTSLTRKYFVFTSVATLAGAGTLAILFFAITDAFSQTCTFNYDYAYKAPNSSAVYYITEDCTKRAFTRADIFFTYFPSWGSVEAAPTLALQMIPNDPLGFMPFGPLYDPKYGALIKIIADPKVYLLLGSEKYWITSEEVFLALGYEWNWVEDVDPRLLDKYTIGSEITNTARHPNFTLIKYQGSPDVYRLELGSNGATVKRHIVDEEVFEKLGFRLDRIVTISPNEIYGNGAPLMANDVVTTPKPNTNSNPTPGAIACESNVSPTFLYPIVDPQFITNIVPPPNFHKASGDLKTHSYINTTKVGIPIYAPIDMKLYRGAHYVGGPYFLDFRVSCEVMLRIAHIDPIEKIKKLFPSEPQFDSKSGELGEQMAFKAGEIIAYIYQDVGVLSVGLDFGVYNSTQPNRYKPDYTSEIHNTAICPYDYFPEDLESQYRSKFDLIGQEGLKKDDPSFCATNNSID